MLLPECVVVPRRASQCDRGRSQNVSRGNHEHGSCTRNAASPPAAKFDRKIRHLRLIRGPPVSSRLFGSAPDRPACLPLACAAATAQERVPLTRRSACAASQGPAATSSPGSRLMNLTMEIPPRPQSKLRSVPTPPPPHTTLHPLITRPLSCGASH